MENLQNAATIHYIDCLKQSSIFHNIERTSSLLADIVKFHSSHLQGNIIKHSLLERSYVVKVLVV